MKIKADDSFIQFEEHLRGVCESDCFYCGREEDILEQRYKKAKKLGEMTWEDVWEFNR